LTLGFDWRQEFGPVYAPPPVLITLHGSASVTLHIVAGFDTFGIRKAFEAVRDGTFTAATVGDAILQSLFFYTTDDQGKPMPVVSFTGELAAGAEVSAVIITVGIEGGVGLTVSFLWNDPNHDGKFRISEFLAAALNNPICLFSVSGRVYVFLKLFVKIGFGPFSVSFSFTIVDVTLLDFSATPNCQPPPPKLAGLSSDGKTLVVYAGRYGHTTQRGDSAWDNGPQDNETVKITSLHDYTDPANPKFTGVAVDMLGIRRSFTNANIKRVVVDGRGYGKPMNVTFLGDTQQSTARTGAAPPTAQFDRDAIVFGGSGDDNIKTGIGNSWVDGGAGNDHIVTGDRTVLNAAQTAYLNDASKARVAGGPGDDSITVGNGNDIVAGDSSLGAPPTTNLSLTDLKNDGRDSGNPLASGEGEGGANVDVPNWTSLPDPTATEGGSNDGNDVISAGLGSTTLFGNGGRDTLSISPDNQLAKVHPNLAALFTSAGAKLTGGTGDDTISGGTGGDTIVTGPTNGGLNTNPDAVGGSDDGSVNVVDTGTGTDTVYGSTGVDRVTGHSTPTQKDNIRGGAGEDILIGGYGQDSVFGGPDDDYVIAEPSTVDLGASSPPPSDGGFGPLYTVTHSDLPAGTQPSSKTLVGGTGNDHIIGGDGGAAIDGDKYNPTTRCGPGAATASDPVSESVNSAQDGNDKIIGGAGVDNVRAGGGNDLATTFGADDLVCGEKGTDALHGGDAADQIWGGSGPDSVFGDAGDDSGYGNDGNDSLYGGDQNDLLEGNNGSDFASGGTGNDVVLGGTRLAGRPDQGDTLNGDVGTDVLIGDNGALVSGAWVPLDLSGATPAAGGADLIFGGDDGDIGFGGLAADTMHGGTGADHFEGNNAGDTIYGEDDEDELVGGGAQTASAGVGFPDGSDVVYGGSGADVITGDNAVVTTVPAGASTDTVLGRGFLAGHTITLLDLGYAPTAGTSSGDALHGDDGTDVIYGQGGTDTITGDSGDDYAEGGPGVDGINGGSQEDDLVGGSSTPFASGVGQPDEGDVIAGNSDADVVIGDNGKVLRTGTPNPLTNRTGMTSQRAIVLYDLGTSPHAASSGDDLVTGDDGTDVVLGQDGNDRLKGNAQDDYVEGDQGSDWVEGDTGDDDLVGGSSTVRSGDGNTAVGQLDTADAVWGGPGDDAVIGDNALLLRTGPRTRTFNRVGSAGGVLVASRNLALYDLGSDFLTTPAAGQFGDDRLSGGADVDVMYGQDGNDQMSGGPSADYLEGNGGADIVRGDNLLSAAPSAVGEAATSPLSTTWPGSASGAADLEGTGADGQDDLIGGSSLPNFRDSGDSIEGDGESDFQLGDNGVLQRVIQGSAPNLTEKVFVQRYSETAPLPANAAVVRVGDASVNPDGTTRFCVAGGTTCEAAGAFGGDAMFGDSGDDTMWGQDGNDTMHGATGNDDMLGELGNDVMFGEDGADAMLGDRGGIVDELINPSDSGKHFTVDTGGVPKETFVAFRQGTYDHRVDLLHDVNGDAFVGTSTSTPMAHAGLIEGGTDRIRGGNGADDIHAGFGDDLANGDSGGDVVFGDDGADVMWGGRGCDAAIDTPATSPDCYVNGAFDASARGTNDRMVDHLYGGIGGSSAVSLGKKGDVGADILDWRPRGSYAPGTGCTSNPFPEDVTAGTIDPCAWFEMTSMDTPDPADNQHHQGTDWMYGGWDRDVMQGDVSQNGPNPGDRMIDWNGAYNLYSGCNAAYGGFNDIRQHSPAMQTFLQGVTFADGAGQQRSDTSTAGTSGYVELALAYPGADNAHAAGSAFPTTPGHFDTNACTGD
jgi:Ca2+-binding RTX toxin-like protein